MLVIKRIQCAIKQSMTIAQEKGLLKQCMNSSLPPKKVSKEYLRRQGENLLFVIIQLLQTAKEAKYTSGQG